MAPYDQFLLFGDSLTQQSFDQQRGFASGAALQNDYVRRMDVINRGFSGYNTAQALRVLPKIIPTPQQARVRFLAIFFGANDACLPNSPTGQQISVEAYSQYLVKIITHPCVRAHQPRIILITPPPVDEYVMREAEELKGYDDQVRTASHTKLYADATREVGKELNVAVLDLWTAFMDDAGWKKNEPLIGSLDQPPNGRFAELMHDGLHFNPPAYEILTRELRAVIHENWPDQEPKNLPFVFPTWEVAPR